LFRVFDIVKPWPARRLEALPGGSGIMADDLMAGLYANLVLQGFAALRPALLGVA
jgi:phosphatidylglycerophosphatase A